MLNHVLDAMHKIEGVPTVNVSEVQGISVKRGVHEPSKKNKQEKRSDRNIIRSAERRAPLC